MAEKLHSRELIEVAVPLPAWQGRPPCLRRFAEIDGRVAAAKTRLDGATDRSLLAEILRQSDLYAGLKWRVKRDFKAQAATNAWLKIYEIATRFSLVEYCTVGGRLRLFANAELPGAFICALNHYTRTMMPASHFDWVASSLWPESGNEALGDVYGVYAGNPGRWLMGPDDRGDLTVAADVRSMAARARERLGAVMLYTSDAGIDVSSDFNGQEKLNLQIHFGQAVAGVMALAAGGCFVVKHYTLNAPFTISLIVELAQLFGEFFITKPLTSRPHNSETYLVGKNFRELPPNKAERWLRRLEVKIDGKFDEAPLVDLTDKGHAGAVAAVLRAAALIHETQQTAFLDEAMGFYHEIESKRCNNFADRMKPIYKKAQQEWLKTCRIKPLPDGGKINILPPPK